MIFILPLLVVWFTTLSGLTETIPNLLYNLGIHRVTFGFKQPIRLYVLDCSKCLGFWTGLIYQFRSGLIEAIVTGILVSLMSIILEKLYIKHIQ